MRAKEFLSESEGGIIRRSQEVAQGKTVTFAAGDTKINLKSAIVIPETEEAFETVQDLAQVLDSTLASLGNPKVMYATPMKNSHRAALITIWTGETGEKLAFIKLANAKKPGVFPITWTNADFGRETGYKQIDNKVAQRAQFNLKPDALLPAGRDIEVAKITEYLNFSARPDLSDEIKTQITQLLNNVLTGSKTPVTGAAQYATTYEVDLGEIAAPISLATGNFASGSYREAEKALLEPLGLSWNSLTTVNYPSSGSNQLYDSYMHLTGDSYLKISSKDKKGGAAASITGLISDVQKFPERFKDVTDNKSYLEILKIVSTLATQSAIKGPLKLAMDFGIISSEDAVNVSTNLGQGIKYNPNLRWARTPGIRAALGRKGAKFEDPAYDMGYHVLAGISELIADRLNQMPNIDNFFRAILERSTMIQVKSQVVKSGDGAAFNNFTVIYPPVFTGHIKVVAGNNYMATRRPIGKISFKIG